MIAYVPSAVLRIGRGTNAELRFDDVAVALEHAVIEPAERGYRLLDRGSATGTYLNGKPVHEALLSANDLINIGGYQIRVQITDPDDPLFLSVRTSAPGGAEGPAPGSHRGGGAGRGCARGGAEGRGARGGAGDGGARGGRSRGGAGGGAQSGAGAGPSGPGRDGRGGR